MVNMKKILGILLALCFVMSVTAATAAAGDGSRDNHQEKYNKFGHGNDKKFGHYKSFFKYNAPCGYWKKVVIVKKIGFGHNKKVIKTIKWIWTPTRNHNGHGPWCQFKFPHGR